jgi:hypothetical protein
MASSGMKAVGYGTRTKIESIGLEWLSFEDNEVDMRSTEECERRRMREDEIASRDGGNEIRR